MKTRTIPVLLAMVATGAIPMAQAAQGDFVVRGRATLLDFDNGQNNLPVEVKADSRWIPEVDLNYHFTDRIAAELVLTWPQKVDITMNGTDAGSVRALPPTLLGQYRFADNGRFAPYLGAGLNLTVFGQRGLLEGAARTSRTSLGWATQVGADFALTERWSLNVDIKYLDMDTGVFVSGNRIGTLDLNPWVASVGLGYKMR